MDRLKRLRDQVVRARFDAWERTTIPDPIEHPWQYRYLKLRWRAALVAVMHPVILALTVALAVVAIPVSQLVGVQSTLRVAQHRLDDQQAVITGLVASIQHDRARASYTFCTRLNENQRQAAKLTNYLRALIVSGARQSKAFEDLYRAHGFPGYRERLRTAERQARKIASFSPHDLNCEQAVQRIERDTPSPLKHPPPRHTVHGNP